MLWSEPSFLCYPFFSLALACSTFTNHSFVSFRYAAGIQVMDSDDDDDFDDEDDSDDGAHEIDLESEEDERPKKKSKNARA